jgi:hypothetical protein
MNHKTGLDTVKKIQLLLGIQLQFGPGTQSLAQSLYENGFLKEQVCGLQASDVG